MSSVGQIERATQNRVIDLFKNRLGYDYFGDWPDRPGNACIEDEYLEKWLAASGVAEAMARRAIWEFHKAADDSSATLANRNKAVYGLLRYGVKLSPEVGENHQTVWLIDWEQPERNHFALAEEVTVEDSLPFGREQSLDQAARYRPLRQRDCPGRPRTQAGECLGFRRHTPESGQSEARVHPALLCHDAVDYGGQ